MKKLAILAFIGIFGLNLSAQVVTLTNEENVVYGTAADETQELGVAWSVTNATGGTIDFKCKRVAIAEVPGAFSQFCWGILCSPWNLGTATLNEIVTLAPGETTNSFFAKYRHYGNAGQSVFSYCFFNANDPSQEFCYNVNYCVDAECIVKVAENTKTTGSISSITPNPMVDKGIISYQFNTAPTDGQLVVYSMLGAVVKKVKLTAKQGVVVLNSNELENGIYFCAIQNEGKVFQTARLVVSH